MEAGQVGGSIPSSSALHVKVSLVKIINHLCLDVAAVVKHSEWLVDYFYSIKDKDILNL